MILRTESGTDDWNTIARRVNTTRFVDNTCTQGVAYDYCIKAIDHSDNLSERSLTVSARPSGHNSLIAWLPMDGNTNDRTLNMMDAVAYDEVPEYTEGALDGTQALVLNGKTNYVQLPYEVANTDELTVALWVNWRTTSNWQRIFDFGNGTDQYMFLTPSNGSVMRFAMKNGGAEQTLDCPRMTSKTWTHVAVTIGPDATTIYVNGVAKATNKNMTIKPSDIHPLLNYIGRSQFPADPLFNDYIGDVRIFNYALPDNEVAGLMNNTATGVMEISGLGFDNNSESQDVSPYDLQGRQVKSSMMQKGIYISRGKKVVVRQ
jgi:hypothetical protein